MAMNMSVFYYLRGGLQNRRFLTKSPWLLPHSLNNCEIKYTNRTKCVESKYLAVMF